MCFYIALIAFGLLQNKVVQFWTPFNFCPSKISLLLSESLHFCSLRFFFFPLSVKGGRKYITENVEDKLAFFSSWKTCQIAGLDSAGDYVLGIKQCPCQGKAEQDCFPQPVCLRFTASQWILQSCSSAGLAKQLRTIQDVDRCCLRPISAWKKIPVSSYQNIEVVVGLAVFQLLLSEPKRDLHFTWDLYLIWIKPKRLRQESPRHELGN